MTRAATVSAGPMTLLSRAFVPVPAVIAIGTLCGCATLGTMGDSGPAAAAPTYLVGDRWVYAAHDGFFRTVAYWEETREVIAVSPDGITVRITAKGPAID